MNANRYALPVMEIAAAYVTDNEPYPSPGDWLELRSSQTGGDRASHIKLLREAHATLQREGKSAGSNVTDGCAPLTPAQRIRG